MEEVFPITRTMLVNVFRGWREAELAGLCDAKAPDDIEQGASEAADYVLNGLRPQIPQLQ